MGVDEPMNYEQAVKDRNWREAMSREIEAVEKKWNLEAYKVATWAQSYWVKMGL